MPWKNNEQQREYKKKWYAKNRKKVVLEVAKRRSTLRNWFREFKKTLKCEKCGETHPACMDFHHRDPSEKDFEISQWVSNGMSKKRLMDEVAKCDILCRNCHSKLHYEE